jgi:hypothetical protein
MTRRHISAIAGLAALTAIPLAAQAAKPTQGAPTLGARPDPVVFGHAVALSGKLSGPNAGGKTVVIQADEFPFEGNFGNIGNATTNGAGHYSFSTKPSKNTRYLARQGNRASPVVTELVALRVSLGLSDSTPSVGQRVRFSGQACPEHDGALVRLQRRRPNGSYGTVQSTSLKDLAGSTCSRYSTRRRISSDGTFRIVVLPTDGDHARGISPARHANAH